MKRLLVTLLVLTSFLAQARQNTLLDAAFWKNNPDVAAVKAEVAKGNDPAAFNRSSFDPTVLAINANASAEVITYLLEQEGNDVNKITHDSRTYIFWAAARGNLPIVEYLIKKGAKLDLRDSHGSTVFGFASGGGAANIPVFEALVKGGGDIKQKNQDGASLLLTGIASDKDLALTNYLISKGLSLQETDAAGNTAFNYAARSGNIELMKTLLQKGVKYTDNAMIMASQGGRGGGNGLPVFQYLESLNIKASAVNKNGENALHNLARRPNQQEIIRYFIAGGASLKQADNEGNTPFMNAAASNRDTATLALLLPGVNINQPNKQGATALTMAVRSNSPEIVQFLVRNGADVKVSDGAGNNLAYYLVQSYSAGGGGTQAAQDPFSAKLAILSQAGFNPAAPQKDGNTLYHLAIIKNDLSLLKRIETLQVDVNAKNKEGITPLHKAAMVSKDDAILKYLLSIGAKKEATTSFKETAYDLAKENEQLSKTNVSVDFLK
ncbi:MAG: ankyrin repeat domain-containing protein [Niastella sp.]|nr:ankyrin repeat domain-containing protein [Niastella sp.]